MKAGLYARVSTVSQDLESQKQKLTDWAESNDYDFDLYAEKESGKKDNERGEYEKLMSNLDQYDVVAVTKLDRLGRSLSQILDSYERMEDRDIAFVTLDAPIDTRDEAAMGDIMIKLLSVVADVERTLIRERAKENFQKAVDEGRVGRPSKLNDEQEKLAYELFEDQGKSVGRIKERFEGMFENFDASESAIYRAVQREKE